ncbi:endonuclease/exonuclease/phosphatase family protein [Paenarthrobacter nitroguajacolicus]|uniref:endonuclease/exonuclease/phosphatase family protein n=1 Tax=Paenarthrobacter nitroguajacolicus TaxID=211146 RepID=UPI000B865679|nr:endonuclease/exonuclease/phosphatase family protein [Paenarthrobacter nitroguajacolicus]
MTHPGTAVMETRPAPRHASLAWSVMALLAALPVAGVSMFRAIPAEWPLIVVQLLSFTPWMVLPAALALVLALVGRRRWVIITTAALLAAQLFWLFPLDAGKPDSLPAGTATIPLRVMSLNSEYGEADAAIIVNLVRDNGIQLLTIQEHTQGLEDRLTSAGMEDVLPNRVSEPNDDASGGAVYSVFPLEPDGLLPDTPFRIDVTRVLVSHPESGAKASLNLSNVHALPPVDERIDQWRRDLGKIARQASESGNHLLMGDYNATYDHSEFRALLDTALGGGPQADTPDGKKLVDVGMAAGARFFPTSPMEGPLLPGIVIDHMVTSTGISSSDYAVHRVPGSDHAAIMARLIIPAG